MRSLALGCVISIVVCACSTPSASDGASQPDGSLTGAATASAASVSSDASATATSATAAATASAHAPTAAATAASAAASASATALETKKLTLSQRSLRVDGDRVLFEPDRGVQKAKYTTYSFEKAAFEAKVGKLPLKGDVEVDVEVSGSSMKTSSPSDPKLPTPVGGISTVTYDCKIVSVKK